jgi:hypothetical protein
MIFDSLQNEIVLISPIRWPEDKVKVEDAYPLSSMRSFDLLEGRSGGDERAKGRAMPALAFVHAPLQVGRPPDLPAPFRSPRRTYPLFDFLR